MTEREKAIQLLVSDCLVAHQEIIIVKLIAELEKDYEDLAKLATMGEYNTNWTHPEVLDYITYET
jgi:hypothetical protein